VSAEAFGKGWQAFVVFRQGIKGGLQLFLIPAG